MILIMFAAHLSCMFFTIVLMSFPYSLFRLISESRLICAACFNMRGILIDYLLHRLAEVIFRLVCQQCSSKSEGQIFVKFGEWINYMPEKNWQSLEIKVGG